MPDDLIGASVRRIEDYDLLIGGASFVDDIRLDGVLHAAFVRSARRRRVRRRVSLRSIR